MDDMTFTEAANLPTLSFNEDGKPMFDGVPFKAASLDISMTGSTLPEVVITRHFGIGDLSIKNVKALIDDETARMLVRIGWTPPEGVEVPE